MCPELYQALCINSVTCSLLHLKRRFTVTPILEIRKLWLEEVKYLAQNYTMFINPTLSRIATLARYLEYEGQKLGQAGKL